MAESAVFIPGTIVLGSKDISGVITGVTTGTGVSSSSNGGVRELVYYVVGVGTISAGTLVIEEAPAPDYGGTWSQIGASIDLTALTGGATQAVHLSGVFCCTRARVTVNLTGGGTVYVALVGN